MGKTVFFTSSPKQTIHLTDTSLSVPKVCTWNQQDNTIKKSVRLVFLAWTLILYWSQISTAACTIESSTQLNEGGGWDRLNYAKEINPKPCVYQPTFLFMFCWCHGCSDPEHTFKYIQTPWREKKLYIFQFYQRHVFLLTFGILRQPGEFFHSDRLLFDTFRTYSIQWIRPLVDGLLEVGVTLFDFRGLSAPLVLAQRRQVTRSSIELVSN